MSAVDLDRHIDAATQALLARQHEGRRPLGLRPGSRRHQSVGIHPAQSLSRRARKKDRGGPRGLHPQHPGRTRRLAAVPQRRLRHERLGESLFRPEDGRRRHRCRPHAPRAQGDLGPRRRRACKRLHPLCPRAVRRSALARGAGDAGGIDAGAALVPGDGLPLRLLVAHGDRAASRVGGAEAAREEPARRADPGVVPRPRRSGSRLTCTTPPAIGAARSSC